MDRPRPTTTRSGEHVQPRSDVSREEWTDTAFEQHKSSLQSNLNLTPQQIVLDNAFMGITIRHLTTTKNTDAEHMPYHTPTYQPQTILQNQPKVLFKAR